MSCVTWIVLALITEFIVLGLYHLTILADKDAEIKRLKEKPGSPDFIQDRVYR